MTLLAYQAINRKIGIALTSPDQVKREEFEQTAQEYSRAVSSVNERINKAYGFIQSGLVGEAVQECEREPNVIDSAQLLDVYLEQQWAELHKRFKLKLPPRVLIGEAVKLNAAYSKQADLGELLRKHRLLALGRAPVKDRLLLLRTIAKRDPNDVWDKDMVELEFVRLGEIKMEVKRLANLQDAHQIHQLYNEVTANNWHVRVPLELLGDLGHLKDEVDVKSAREELVSIASELSHAHARGNVRSGRENREEWNKQLKLANLPKDHPSRKLPLTALSWLKDEDAKEDAKNQFRAQQVRFKTALDDDASQAVLQQQHEALVGSGFKLNPDLANEYEERIGDFKFAKRRKVISEFVTFLILTSIVAVIGYFAIKWALDQQIRESGVKE